jgi:hypothetical protein
MNLLPFYYITTVIGKAHQSQNEWSIKINSYCEENKTTSAQLISVFCLPDGGVLAVFKHKR